MSFLLVVSMTFSALGCGKITGSVSVEDLSSVEAEKDNNTETYNAKEPEDNTSEFEGNIDEESEELSLPEEIPFDLDVIELTGKEEDKITTNNYSVLVSEKYILCIDKDITLPGNFQVVVDDIVDEVENELNLCYNPADADYYYLNVTEGYVGCEPFKNIDFGKKIPIYLMNDRVPVGYISWATDNATVLVLYDIMSDELWNSIPDFRDNPWRRLDYIDYEAVAHELTHTITSRHATFSKIMTEGIATHVENVVTKKLSEKYESVHFEEKIYDRIPDMISRDNAEKIFLSDYQEISHADRGAEYTLGMIICDYMYETFGQNAFKEYVDEVKKLNLDFGYGMQNADDMAKLTQAMKTAFGDDFFEKFGDWYGKNIDKYRMFD